MEKSEFRAVIKHLYLKGLPPKEIKAELNEVHGILAPVFATVYNWVFEGKRTPKMAKMVNSAGKVMAMVFSYARGIIYTDYLKKEETITGAYYASLLHRLSEESKKKRPHLKKILFRQYNVRIHTCAVSMAKIMELKFELLHAHCFHWIWPPVTLFYF